MRTATILATLCCFTACDKSQGDTAPPGSGDAPPAAEAQSEEEAYGEGSSVLVSAENTDEDINTSETLGSSVETEGSLGPDEVNNVVVDKMDQVGKCYQEGMNRTRNADLEGTVIIEFTIGKDGKVTESAPGQTTLKEPETEKCIAEAVKGWKFPKPPEGDDVKVTFPFPLKPY